jgi:hypothetical protein
MPARSLASTFLALFKVTMILAVGALVGFLLGLAYASHLYGTPPVVMQIQNWFAGDTLIEGPPPVDQSGNILGTPVVVIPRMGACIGFFTALTILGWTQSNRLLKTALQSASKSAKPPRFQVRSRENSLPHDPPQENGGSASENSNSDSNSS